VITFFVCCCKLILKLPITEQRGASRIFNGLSHDEVRVHFVKNLRASPFIEDFSIGYHFQPDPCRWTVTLMEDVGLTFANENVRNEISAVGECAEWN
jgi:hypothetical protein